MVLLLNDGAKIQLYTEKGRIETQKKTPKYFSVEACTVHKQARRKSPNYRTNKLNK